MPTYVLPDANRERPFSGDDLVSHLRKFWQRQFGFELPSDADVSMVGNLPMLRWSDATGDHTITYARQERGHLEWFMDGSEEPIKLLPGPRAARTMRALVGIAE